MSRVIFAFPGYEDIADNIAKELHYSLGKLFTKNYPDGESLIQIKTDIRGKEIYLIGGLKDPDSKIMGLIFFAETARELGVGNVHLVAPYLAYMRQDKRFQKGESISSEVFGSLVSKYFDSIITIDPHLHRHRSLSEVYFIPNKVLHASKPVADWIKHNVEKPLLIGPDEESKQWVADIANKAKCPFIVLNKVRHGDMDVEISVPEIEDYETYTPVLVDDIISTAGTMIKVVKYLNRQGKRPVCIGIHAVFAGSAYDNLMASGVERVVTCNTIPHTSNAIDISKVLAEGIKSLSLDNELKLTGTKS